MDKEKMRSDNLDRYARRTLDPVWRAEQIKNTRDYRRNAPIEVRERERGYKKKWQAQRGIWRRALALDHYGGCCACCGEDRDYFLAMDHIDGGGNKHRKKIGFRSLSGWLFENNWPEGFQVLCHNCNTAKYRFGVCPCQEL